MTVAARQRNAVFTVRLPYQYRLSSTGHSSERYGPCEICKLHCSEVFIQAEARTFMSDGKPAWTHHECTTLFGHEACLINARRGDPALSINPVENDDTWSLTHA